MYSKCKYLSDIYAFTGRRFELWRKLTLIDIHCHLLYGVDDGSKSLEESVEMLKIAKKQGITGIILTPHLRHGMFSHPLEKIEKHYKKLKPYSERLGIELKLGTEYHVATDMIDAFKDGRCHTLADTQYILTEYSHASEYSFVHKMTREALFAGYVPVIAHVERYECLRNIDRIEELRNMGALIQVNADSILGLDGRHFKKYTKKLLKEDLVDVVGSDSHGVKERACNMKKCYDYVAKKFGEDYAEELMQITPENIINGR